MKWLTILTRLMLLALMISACGAEVATPTPADPAVDIQGTMAAAAFTIVAETQAALPTSTPVPPTPTVTDTPPPTNTPLALPSSEVTLTPAPGGNTGGDDPCVNRPLPASVQGEVRMRITNSTQADLSVLVYLLQAGPQTECGYRSYTLAAGEPLVLNNLVEGCYTLWAWNPIPDEYFIVTNGTTCIDESDSWVFDISTRSITLRN
jgi:hypothetical protein